MKPIISIFMLLLSNLALANNYGSVVENMFSEIVKGQYQSAIYTGLVNSYKNIGANVPKDALKDYSVTLANDLKAIESQGGRLNGYELVGESKLGSKYARLRYLLFFDKALVEINISMYAPRGDWAIKNIRLDTDVDARFNKYSDAKF